MVTKSEERKAKGYLRAEVKYGRSAREMGNAMVNVWIRT